MPFTQLVNGVLQLRRGKEIVSDLFSTLGSRRETRITATLGYLIAKAPNAFGPIFLGRQSVIEEVLIEDSEESNRYDVVIRTPRRLVVVEAKSGYEQTLSQIKRYVRKLIRREPDKRVTLYLLDKGSDPLQRDIRDFRQTFSRCKVRSKTWTKVAQEIEKACRSRRLERLVPEATIIGRELVHHLKETQMAESQSKEIYIR
jgi:hypothetical protein